MVIRGQEVKKTKDMLTKKQLTISLSTLLKLMKNIQNIHQRSYVVKESEKTTLKEKMPKTTNTKKEKLSLPIS